MHIAQSRNLNDVTSEYLKTARPGTGSVICGVGYVLSKHTEEIKTAAWINEFFGGDIVLLPETNKYGVKTPDYFWNNANWELKNVSSARAVDGALRNAIRQIARNPGGIILKCEGEIRGIELENAISDRLNRSCGYSADIMILKDNTLDKVLRYKK